MTVVAAPSAGFTVTTPTAMPTPAADLKDKLASMVAPRLEDLGPSSTGSMTGVGKGRGHRQLVRPGWG